MRVKSKTGGNRAGHTVVDRFCRGTYFNIVSFAFFGGERLPLVSFHMRLAASTEIRLWFPYDQQI